MRFMVEVEGHFPRDPLCVRLVNHLQKHCEQISKGPASPIALDQVNAFPVQVVQSRNPGKTAADFSIPKPEPENSNSNDAHPGVFSATTTPRSDDFEKETSATGMSYKYKTNIKLRFTQDLSAHEVPKRQKLDDERRNSCTIYENQRWGHFWIKHDISPYVFVVCDWLKNIWISVPIKVRRQAANRAEEYQKTKSTAIKVRQLQMWRCKKRRHLAVTHFKWWRPMRRTLISTYQFSFCTPKAPTTCPCRSTTKRCCPICTTTILWRLRPLVKISFCIRWRLTSTFNPVLVAATWEIVITILILAVLSTSTNLIIIGIKWKKSGVCWHPNFGLFETQIA